MHRTPDILRKRVTMLYRPKSPAEAAKIVDRDVAAASFRNTAKRAESARASRAVRAAQATAQEEAQGAGLVNFGTLITATVLEETDLSDAAAMVDDLAAEARLRIRRMYGRQDSGFLGALPIGLVLAKFMAAPSLEDA
ncbi:SCO6880 family protein [Agrococcus sp. SGAir0287]|uniref:SCO6880 family protein n=1 Tax=Agrococcus sp. SGAir0287 TaxID=2070347 RepID=UPI0020C7FB98|nr:SCO6880 family protein [Agrococcus sp. SGAir0287]